MAVDLELLHCVLPGQDTLLSDPSPHKWVGFKWVLVIMLGSKSM